MQKKTKAADLTCAVRFDCSPGVRSKQRSVTLLRFVTLSPSGWVGPELACQTRAFQFKQHYRNGAKADRGVRKGQAACNR